MANQALFNTQAATLPKTDTVNAAGGRAYKLGNKEALAQMAVTGCLSNTFYEDAQNQLTQVLDVAAKVEPEFLAKTAIYARRDGLMKDMPALLMANLATRDPALFEQVAPRVLDNGKMVRNLVQMLRSGQVGIKNLPRPVRRFLKNWILTRDSSRLFNESVGNSPSLADLLKMVHPKPTSDEQAAMFGYLLDRKYEEAKLPAVIRQYEQFKRKETADVPAVEFRMLDSLGLTTSQWTDVAMSMGWQALRMNLNTLQRHGVLKDSKVVKRLSVRLKDAGEIRKSRVFPYQLLTAYTNLDENLPMALQMALQDALEISVENIPVFEGKIVVAPDVSGSMNSPVTGRGSGRASKTTCVHVAALVAAAILRKNPDTEILPFDTSVHPVKLNPRDSIMTNAQILAKFGGGGTNCSLPLADLNRRQASADLVIYVSDNESWVDSSGYYGSATSMMTEWKKFKARNKGAKMILNDIQPKTNTQAKEQPNVYNVGGFSDAVFKFISVVGATSNKTHWRDLIEKIPLDSSK